MLHISSVVSSVFLKSKLYGTGRDVCKSRIHDHRDFRLVPWFLAIAVNLYHGRDYHQNVYNFDFKTVNFGEFV